MATMVPLGPLPRACWTLLISLFLVCCLLLAPGAQGQAFRLRVEPQNPVVPAGGSLLVNCSTDCPQPELISLETSLFKEEAGEGLGWKAYRLSSVTSDSEIFCSGICNGSQMSDSSDITVYQFPERVELAPLPPNPVGKNLTLRCRVAGHPRAQLSVLLLGAGVLSQQLAVGGVTTTVLASRNDHGANFSCRWELDLRSQGLGLFQNSSVPRQLRTFVLPVTPPRLLVPRFLEVGTSQAVTCTLDGLFPASEAQVHLALGGQMLNATVESNGDKLTARATATASAELEGAQEIVCNVTLGGESQETRENLTIYSFWGPVMNLSQPTVRQGTIVNVTCAAGARVQVTLDGVPAAAPGQPALLQLNASERDDRRSFFCSAALEVDGVVLHKNRSVQLRVLYGPKIDPARCPQHLMWKEKTTQILQCQAQGNPDPQLQCFHEGSMAQVPIGIPFRVRLNYSGTYNCRAASSQGTHTVTVVMKVQERNPVTITIVIAVLTILGFVAAIPASIYVFGVHKRRDIYHVNQGNAEFPLTSKTAEEPLGEPPS
uniref:Intercellular adhesion molecule 3 n=1 Tax=Myotis lucifugus TaxID=59463 RepID=G1PKC0_MYOLU